MGCLPEIVCFGAQKSGTSWLFSNVVQNPGVWEPPLKEMHFFNYLPGRSGWIVSGHKQRLSRRRASCIAKADKAGADHAASLLRYPMMTEEWYRAAYAPCPQDLKTIDVTPAYALLDSSGHDRMEKLLGKHFKGIFLVRDPVGRAISAIRGSVSKNGQPPRTHDDWMNAFRSPPVTKRNDYSSVIKKLDHHLGERVLYLPFGRIRRDPVGVLRDIEDHCDLPAGDYKSADRPRHESLKFPMPDSVAEVIREKLEVQYNFLILRFGREFCSVMT